MNKYYNIWTEYNGIKYQSKKEAMFAEELDLLKRATNKDYKVISWERQLPFKIIVDGVYVCTYRLDFRVHYANGVIRNYDIKGMKSGVPYSMFKLKKKLLEITQGLVIEEI